MNQMTVVEVLDPVDRYTVTGMGYGLVGKVQHAVGDVGVHRRRDPARSSSPATPSSVDGKVVGDPTEGALLVLGAKAGVDVEPPASCSRGWRRCRSTRPTS